MNQKEYELFKLKSELASLQTAKDSLIKGESFYLFQAQKSNYVKISIDQSMNDALVNQIDKKIEEIQQKILKL